MLNDHERPRFDEFSYQLDTEKTIRLKDVEVVFSGGRVQSISVSDPEMLTYFRVLHHLERYYFSENIILNELCHHPKNILDVGIGDGFGVAKLKEGLEKVGRRNFRVSGVEINPETASLCRKNHPDFVIFDGNVLNFSPDEKFDAIFCYELLGNTSLTSDLLLLNKIKSLVEEEGLIFISIATFDESEHGRQRRKSYSDRIYSNKSFVSTIESVFSGFDISFYGQHYPLKRIFTAVNAVWPNPGGVSPSDFSIAVIRKK